MTWGTYWNSAPVARDDVASTEYNKPVTINVLANDYDPNCDRICISGTPTSTNGTVSVNSDGSLTFVPNPGFSGTATICYTITDGKGGYDTATVKVTVCDPPSDGIVSGTAGDDLIDYDYTGDPEGDRIDHGDAILPGEVCDDDIVKAGAGNDTVLAGAGNDEVYGEDGDDLLDGGAGHDKLWGGTGDDTFVGGAGNDTFDGGAGLDMIDYSNSASGVNVNLSTGALSGGDAAGDVITNGVDGIIGSEHADTLVGFDHEGTSGSDIFTNVFYGNGGDDIIAGQGGDDSLYGGADDDSITGGAGDDYIRGDGDLDAASGAGEALTLDWSDFGAAGCSVPSGTTVDLGGVNVTFGFTAQDGGASATVTNAVQYVEAGDGLSSAGGLQLYGCGGEGGIDNTSTTTLSFSSVDDTYGDAVSDVSFRINDIDVGTTSDYHVDIVTVRAYDADGNLLPVTYTVEGGQTISGNTITGHDVDTGGSITQASATGSVLVQIDGPVARIEIDYDNGGNTDQAISITDLNCVTTDGTEGEVAGDDTLIGGAGDDTILGDGGADLISGGDGADQMAGGADADTLLGGAGDTVDGGAEGDDNDTLDLTGQGAYRVVGTSVDSNGNGLDGTIEFLDIDGNVTGTLGFTEIENIIGDDVNLNPHANDDTATVAEDDSVTIDVLANDTDPNGDTLSVTGASATHGSVVVNGDGTLTFTPDADYNGPAEITYTIDDGNGGTSSATVHVTVTPVNDDPVANDDSASTDYNTPVVVDLLGNDTDVDGDTLTLSGTPTSADGTVALNADGTITFTPAAGFSGVAEISYTVTDGNGGFDTATAYVTVAEQPLDGWVEGTTGDDLIDTAYTGDPEGDMIDAGDAILPGDAPNDDRVLAGDGNDTVYAGVGDDTVWGEAGNDEIYGEDGDDSLSGGEGDDTLYGGAGNDTLDAGQDGDTLYGGEGDDLLKGGPREDYMDGGDGNDTLEGGNAGDTMLGGEGDDYVTGNDGNDTVHAGAGNDSVYGDAGDDLLYGDEGDDYLSGGEGDDTVYGGAGNDTLDAGQDGDSLYGEDGDDLLMGGPREDLLDGGAGNDTLEGGNAADTMFGGSGNDLAEGNDGNDYINTGDGTYAPDRGYPGLFAGDTDPNNDLDTVYGGAGNDTILTGDDRDYIDGGTGADSIDAGCDDDTVLGGEGNDYIVGAEGSDLIDAGAGNDTVYAGLAPGYPDFLNVPDATDLVPDNGRDTVHGGDGDDVVYGADDDDMLYGDAGNDYLDGGIDEDTISGGTGNDTIIGGAGADSLTGGDDRDLFIVTTGAAGAGDVIDGSEGGDDYDQLDLTGAGPLRVIYDSGNPENGTVNFLDADGNITGTLAFSNIENVIPCFTPGTLVATPRGEKLVEELQPGDKVITRDNGIQEIRWAGRRDLTRTELMEAPHLRPILIRAGALGNGLPERDMLVSPNHRMLVANERTALYFEEHEVLVAAKHLIDNRGVKPVETLGTSYLHFMFDRHEVVLANGAWTESFQPGDQTLGGMGNAQRAEIFELFPALKTHAGIENYGAARKTLKRHEAKLLLA